MRIKIACIVLMAALCVALTAGCGNSADKPPKDPNAIATVTTGDTVTVITDIAQLADTVDSSGNSTVKLWKDLDAKTTVALPYSCTLDLNGYSILTKAGAACTVEIAKAGEENKVTTVKNGTLEHYGIGIRVKGGGFVIDGMTFYGVSGETIVLTDIGFSEKGVSTVKNSQFYSYGNAFLSFQASGSFQNTDITLENCTIVQYRPNGTPIFSRDSSETTPATVIFGEKVDLYSYGTALAEEGFYYAGNLVPAAKETKSVTVKDQVNDGLTHWSTENEDNAINLLMIGNSFCYYYVQELYGVAHAAGVEINVTNLYEAGCYVEEHWNWLTNEIDGAGKYQYWVTNSMGRWRHGQITASYDALKYLDWDVITLQQHFGGGIKDYEAAKAKCVPHTKNLYDYLKKNHPDSELYWQTTWAYQVGHESMASAAEQKLKQNNIIALSQELADESGVKVIPSGQAWTIARADSRVGDVLCRTDLYHDGDTGGGQYLNACVWFEVLTGKSCIGNTWQPTYLLDETKIAALQQAAHQAVADMYGADYAK